MVAPSYRFLDNWHIGAICEHLEAVSRRQIKRLLINVPFRTAKSTVVSVLWPAWTWIHDPAHKWLWGSYAAKLAIRDNLAMRRLIQSPWYQERWGRRYNLADNSDWGDPEGFELTDDQNQKARFENDRTGYRIAFGFDGGVMGEGADTVGIDDPQDYQKATSDKERESSLAVFDNAIITRLNEPAKSAVVIIMQRLHQDDLSGHVLAEGGYEHLMIPMRFDPKRIVTTSIGFRDPRTFAGELMHPERFPEEYVAEFEKRNPKAAAGQFQQQPAPPEGDIIKSAWFRFYNDDEDPKLPDEFEEEGQSWDMAFKKTETSHYVAGQHWGRVGARCYLSPDEVFDRLDFVGSVAAVRAFTKRHHRGAKWVEDKANGPAIMNSLETEIPGFIAVPNSGGAEALVTSIAIYIEAGNVWLPNPYNCKADKDGRVASKVSVRPERQWVTRLIHNASIFPNGSVPSGSHSDDVVAMAQALDRLLHGAADGFGVVDFYGSFVKDVQDANKR